LQIRGSEQSVIAKIATPQTVIILIKPTYSFALQDPMAARFKVKVCGRSPAEIVGSNPTGGMDICLL
jgi:hypothetical protein